MTRLERALVEVAGVLDGLRIPYMLIGGLAVAQWEEPRATLDIDVTVWVEPEELESVIGALSRSLSPKPKDPVAFVKDVRVLPAMTSQDVPVDLIFAAWLFEKEAIQNAPERLIEGHTIRVAPLEYLLFLKLTSERDKDFQDALRLVRRHRGRFDSEWLEQRLHETAEALGQPSILDRYRRASQ